MDPPFLTRKSLIAHAHFSTSDLNGYIMSETERSK